MLTDLPDLDNSQLRPLSQRALGCGKLTVKTNIAHKKLVQDFYKSQPLLTLS